MPTANALTGETHPVGPFFRNLKKVWEARNEPAELIQVQGRDLGLITSAGLHSLDNGYNNLESSLGPVPPGPDSLDMLADRIRSELLDVDQVLKQEQAMVINFSEHPRVMVDIDFYLKYRAPRSIYSYSVGHRGWNHMAGFDSKAHNSPSTSMSVDQCIPALNCLLALAPAFTALYANSPFEKGRITKYKENRLTFWERLFSSSRMPEDRRFCRPPEKPFRNLAEYMVWMFGPGTRMWFADIEGQVKNPDTMYLIPGDPPLLDYLRGGRQLAYPFGGGPGRTANPCISTLVCHQFTQFSDCRLRYGLLDNGPELEKFLDILDNHPHKLEELFAPHLSYCYLEGRSSGANFADQELTGLDQHEIPASVAVSPSALQYGLLMNLNQAGALVAEYAWKDLAGLRMEAARFGLDAEYNGVRVRDLCAKVIDVAGQGLRADQVWMLAYPQWVLRTGRTGADRALMRFDNLPGPPEERIWKLILERRMLPA